MRQGSGQKQGLAVASLILGIFSITIGWCCSIGLLSAPVGIVLGIISLVQIKNDPVTNTGKPLSIIGICLSGFYIGDLVPDFHALRNGDLYGKPEPIVRQ